MNNKHTPGPWETAIFDNPEGKYAIRGGKNVHGKPFVIAWVNKPGQALAGEPRANKNLIAASPDLLQSAEAVLVRWRELVEALPQDDRIENIEFEEFMDLRAAVAKARGINSWEVSKMLEGRS